MVRPGDIEHGADPLARTEIGAPTKAPERAEPADRLPPGTRVGRYAVGDVLGHGGMGVVYAATDPELGRDVAVKLVRGDVARGLASARRRMVREAQAMARVSHPNVIAVYDAGTFGGDVFIAMELVRGQSLRGWLASGARSVADILEAYLAAGRGLAAAHAAGLVHRDFKPDNVLVGHDGRVRVTDFGLAYSDGDDLVPLEGNTISGEPLPDEPLALTMTGAILGTPPYMAPEQHDGGLVDARSDQFAFCIALYEALYGERPFPGRTRDDIARAVRAGRVAPPPAGARVPGSLRSILLRGLARRPGDRFPTMDSLLRALGRDRGRLPRRLAAGAAIALVIVAVALFADWIVRDRALAVTRTSFGAARAQLGRLLALRTEAFAATSDLSYVVPVLREVAGNLDQADFGLGEADDDKARLAEIHEHLASADWVVWARAIQGGDFAIADYKGRLLYASAAPARWGNDVMTVPAIASAYRAGAGEPRTAVVRGDAPDVIDSGLLGGAPRPGLHVLFTRVTEVGDQPRLVFVQSVSGSRLLSEVSLGEGTLMGLAAPFGAAEGSIPPPVLAAGLGAGNDVEEIHRAGQTWLVQRVPLAGPTAIEAIADIVLARRVDVGLAGLFPGARTVLAVASLALALIILAGLVEGRRRDLTRRAPRARPSPAPPPGPAGPAPGQPPPAAQSPTLPETQLSEG
jgi:predicted Ser/Thr protein kinase